MSRLIKIGLQGDAVALNLPSQQLSQPTLFNFGSNNTTTTHQQHQQQPVVGGGLSTSQSQHQFSLPTSQQQQQQFNRYMTASQTFPKLKNAGGVSPPPSSRQSGAGSSNTPSPITRGKSGRSSVHFCQVVTLLIQLLMRHFLCHFPCFFLIAVASLWQTFSLPPSLISPRQTCSTVTHRHVLWLNFSHARTRDIDVIKRWILFWGPDPFWGEHLPEARWTHLLHPYQVTQGPSLVPLHPPHQVTHGLSLALLHPTHPASN